MNKTRISLLKLAGHVYREEGVTGFYRGLWIPLVTISFVRTYPAAVSLSRRVIPLTGFEGFIRHRLFHHL